MFNTIIVLILMVYGVFDYALCQQMIELSLKQDLLNGIGKIPDDVIKNNTVSISSQLDMIKESRKREDLLYQEVKILDYQIDVLTKAVLK